MRFRRGLMQLVAYGASDVKPPQYIVQEFLMTVIWKLRIAQYASVSRTRNRLHEYRDELTVVVAQRAN